MALKIPITCPWCKDVLPLMSSINKGDTPEAGDVTYCITCRKFSALTIIDGGVSAMKSHGLTAKEESRFRQMAEATIKFRNFS
jgi:hypothetical protein